MVMGDDLTAWAAGLAEGEGCWYVNGFLASGAIQPRFELNMFDEEPVARFAEIIDVPHKSYFRVDRGKAVFRIRTAPKALPLGEQFSPWLGIRRREKIAALGGRLLPQRCINQTAWLAGLLEAEGCFSLAGGKGGNFYPNIGLTMNDFDVVERVAAIFQRKVRPFSRAPAWHTSVAGKDAVVILHEIGPLMSNRRQIQIASVIKGKRP
jgi:hypothetical protein